MEAPDSEAEIEAPAENSGRGGGILTTGLKVLGLFGVLLAAQVAAPPINELLYGDASVPPPSAAGEAELEAAAAPEPAVPEPAPAPQVDPADLDPPLYAPLDPPLIVSLNSADGRAHFLQLSVQAMSRDQKDIDAIRTHAPALRNSFLFLVATHMVEDVSTREGKEQLRFAMLDEARAVMQQNTGRPAIEELYFTSFVIQ